MDNNNQTPALYEAAAADYVTDIIPAYAMQNADLLKQYREKLQGFTGMLNQLPPAESVDQTPDKKAYTILISHIEMTLDEFFFGEWETYDFKWAVIGNEVVGSITLQVVHPVTGRPLRRTGAAAIQIMVDAQPDEFKDQQGDSYDVKMKKKRERNKWALNPDNKKSSALDMGFPKLKAECTKNAAQSLGKLFGRDLNRQKFDNFKGIQRKKADSATAATEAALKNKI